MIITHFKRLTLVLLLFGFATGLGFGQVRTYITADAVANFQSPPSAREVVNTFIPQNQPLYWGAGFEVVYRHLGFGGVYTVNFSRMAPTDWWLDWYAQAFNLSYHLFARRALIDPFIGIGIGSAGRVWIGPGPSTVPAASRLALSLFPAVSAGIGVDLDGFYVRVSASYLPVISPPPATRFENAPLGHFQVLVSGGLAFGR